MPAGETSICRVTLSGCASENRAAIHEPKEHPINANLSIPRLREGEHVRDVVVKLVIAVRLVREASTKRIDCIAIEMARKLADVSRIGFERTGSAGQQNNRRRATFPCVQIASGNPVGISKFDLKLQVKKLQPNTAFLRNHYFSS